MERMIIEVLKEVMSNAKPKQDDPNMYTDEELIKEVTETVGTRLVCKVHRIGTLNMFTAPTEQVMAIESGIIIEIARKIGLNKTVDYLTSAFAKKFLDDMIS